MKTFSIHTFKNNNNNKAAAARSAQREQYYKRIVYVWEKIRVSVDWLVGRVGRFADRLNVFFLAYSVRQ